MHYIYKMESILAVDSNNGLSKNGIIPWKSKKDLLFFYKKTKNNIVIMGKNTYFSIPEENRPLKNRLNIILTRTPSEYITSPYKEPIENNLIFTSDDKIYETILANREKYSMLYPYLSSNFKIFIIGGLQIYERFLPLCQTVWVTYIKANFECDLVFDYDFEKQFKGKIVEEDDSLKIVEYVAKKL